jgi:hypothetical protein
MNSVSSSRSSGSIWTAGALSTSGWKPSSSRQYRRQASAFSGVVRPRQMRAIFGAVTPSSGTVASSSGAKNRLTSPGNTSSCIPREARDARDHPLLVWAPCLQTTHAASSASQTDTL